MYLIPVGDTLPDSHEACICTNPKKKTRLYNLDVRLAFGCGARAPRGPDEISTAPRQLPGEER
jgi:hypothetical protein